MLSPQELAQVLRHVHRFLALIDVANILGTCQALRNDRAIATRVLESNVHSRHFFQECPLDWFWAIPRSCVLDGQWKRCYAVDERIGNGRNKQSVGDIGQQTLYGDHIDVEMKENSLTSESSGSLDEESSSVGPSGPETVSSRHLHRRWQVGDEFSGAPFQRAQLINLVCLVERLLLHWSYQPVVVADELHVVRPVVLPVEDLEHSRDGWEVRDRLNHVKSGTRIKLVTADPHRTCFGVHWDNIRVSGSRVFCACCETYEPTINDYRHTVSLLYRRWLTTTESCRASWRDQGFSSTQIDEMVDVMREELLPSHGFFNEAMASAGDEELIEYICSNTNMAHSFDVCQDQPTHPERYSWRSVFHPTMISVCREIIVPLKIAMNERLLYTTRASARWDADECTSASANASDCELPHWSDIVVGVFPGGFLVGFYYMSD